VGVIEPRVSISIKTQFAEICTLDISWSYINFSLLPSLFVGKAFPTSTLGGFDSMDKTSINHKEYQSLLKRVTRAKRKRQRRGRNTPRPELTVIKGTTVVVGKEDNLISGF
jgi:hypothetical protein